MKEVPSGFSDDSDIFARRMTQVLFVLSLALIGLRFVHLNYDSPLFYSGYSTSEISDPYMYTSFARNKILFDDWDPFNYARWDSWKLSLVSGVSYLFFLAGGVGRVSANISAIFLQLAGLFFFLLAMARFRPRLEVAFGAFLLLGTSGLFFSGRIPLLENAVICLSGITVWLYFTFQARVWGTALAGALVAVIALAAKLNGVVLLAPLALDILLRSEKTPGSHASEKQRKLTHVAALIVGFVICGIAYSYLIYGKSPSALFNYFQAQTAAVGLTPHIPDSFSAFFTSVLLYGSQNGLFRFQPVFLLLSGAGAILVALEFATSHRTLSSPASRFLLFVCVWLLAGLVLLLPYTYRPSRYFMPALLPCSALAAFALGSALRGSFARNFKLSRSTVATWLLLVFSSLVIVYLSVQVDSFWRQFVIAGKSLVTPLGALSVTIGVIISAVIIVMLRRGVRFKKTYSVIVALMALAALVVRQAGLLYNGLEAPRDPLHVQVQDVGALLGPDAVIAGTYGPAFTIDNKLHTLIHPFSAKRYEKDVFERFHVTHIAVAPSEMNVAQKRYPRLKHAQNVTQIWTRDGSFLIYRVPEVDYAETDYERGMDFLAVANLDSALVYFDSFLSRHPSSLRGRWAKARTLANKVRVEQTVALLDRLSGEYKDYYFVHFFVGREYVTLYRYTRGSQYKTRALAEYKRAKELNPHITPPQGDLP